MSDTEKSASSNNKFLKGTLILTVSSIVVQGHRFAELDHFVACTGRRRDRPLPDGVSGSYPEVGNNIVIGRDTGRNFDYYGLKSWRRRIFWEPNGP